jgi:hypothetical protein
VFSAILPGESGASMPIPGKLEVTIKIHEVPTEVTTKSNGWKEFTLDCGGRPVLITVRPRMWLRLEEARATHPLWVASITGQMGAAHGKGFVLTEPALQVFERKAKVVEAPATPPEEPAS